MLRVLKRHLKLDSFCHAQTKVKRIQSQSYNATHSGPEFCTSNCCITVIARISAYLVMRNVLLTAGWFDQLQLDCTKIILDPRTLE